MLENGHQLIKTGRGGYIALNQIMAIGRWDSAPIKRAVYTARKSNRLIDLTYGKACFWVIFLHSGNIALIPNINIPISEE